MTVRHSRLPLFLLGAIILLAPMVISASARANVFDDVRGAAADALESDNETGGYAVGIIAIVVILFLVVCLMSATKEDNPMFLGIASLSGIAFVLLVGWWPLWTAIFLALGFILMLATRHGSGSA